MNQPSAVSGDLHPSRSKPEWLFNLALTLPFLVLYWINLVHHQLWLDEINVFGIASAAPDLKTLFYLIHFEGHPWLWYWLVWIPSQFTHNPIAIKWVEGIFGTAIYLVLGLVSPFTRWQKILIFLCYYVSFEYTVMSRMYSVMFLLALLYVARRIRKPEGFLGNVLLLGLLANSDSTGMFLSAALILEYVSSLWLTHRGRTFSSELKRNLAQAALAYVALVGISLYTARLAPGISFQNPGHFGSEALQLRRIVESIGNLTATPWWPINKHFPRLFWGSDAIENKWLLLLSPLVIFAYWRIFRRQINLLLLMASTLAIGILFADIILAGKVRHWGIAFVAFLLALWMQRAARDRAGDPSAAQWSPWAYALMTLGALSGVAAMASSWTHPFSQAKNTAEWVRTHEPPDVVLVGQWDMNLASLGQELRRPMYFMECACVDTFKLYAASRDEFPPQELPARIHIAMQKLGTNHVVLVNWLPLTPEDYARLDQASLIATPLVTFDGADHPQESYFLYNVSKR